MRLKSSSSSSSSSRIKDRKNKPQTKVETMQPIGLSKQLRWVYTRANSFASGIAYFIEADNYHNKPRPAFSTLDSYNPDGTKQAEYGTQYDDAGNLTAENFSTFYPSGNVKTFQTVVHENGERSPILTPSKQKPRTEAESIYIERNDMGGAPIQGQTRIITGTDFLAKTNDTSSLLTQQRQQVMKSMPPIFLEMVKR